MNEEVVSSQPEEAKPITQREEAFATKRQVGQIIRQAFERREREEGKREVLKAPPDLEDLKNGQEVEVALCPGQIGPAEPQGYEYRRYVRRGQRLFFFVMEEVK